MSLRHLLAAGRASRLYRGLRERQLASSVSAYNYTPTELGVFVVHAEMDANCAEDAARAAWDQVRVLREGPIEPAEMERVRRIFEARWIRRLETMEGQANHLVEWEALGGWQLGDEYYERFMSVTSERFTQSRTAISHQIALALSSTGRKAHRGWQPMRPNSSTSSTRRRPKPLDPLPPRDIPCPPAEAAAPELVKTEAGVSVYRTMNGLPILLQSETRCGYSIPSSRASVASVTSQKRCWESRRL